MYSHFNTEYGGYTTFSAYYVFYFKKGENTTEMQKKKRIYAAYGEGAMTAQTYQKWFVKFLGIIDILAK